MIKEDLKIKFPVFLVAALIFCYSLLTFAELPAGYESYAERPDILTIQPMPHKDLGESWEKLKRAHLEAAAELVELYPDHEMYFLARDGELLYDFTRAATAKDPKAAKRLHLINISRANMREDLVKEYLAQEGISESTLRSGKKIIFVDTGFSGTIPTLLKSYFDPDLAKNIKTHLLCSSNTLLPSSRVFLTAINPAAADHPPGKMHSTILDYEYMPRYTDRSNQFYRNPNTNRIEPIYSKTKSSDGIVSKQLATKYQQDLLAYANRSDSQNLLKQQRSTWKLFLTLAHQEKNAELKRELKEYLSTNTERGMREALVRDLIEALDRNFNMKPVKESELGLNEIAFKAGSNKNLLIKKYPQWQTILENPSTSISSLIIKEDFLTLGALSDVVRDDEFTRLLRKHLSEHKPTQKSIQFVKSLIEKYENDDLMNFAGTYFGSHQDKDAAPLLEMVIKRGDDSIALVLIAKGAFKNPNLPWIQYPIDLLVERNDSLINQMLLTTVIPKYSAENFYQVQRLFNHILLNLQLSVEDMDHLFKTNPVLSQPKFKPYLDAFKIADLESRKKVLTSLSMNTGSTHNTFNCVKNSLSATLLEVE